MMGVEGKEIIACEEHVKAGAYVAGCMGGKGAWRQRKEEQEKDDKVARRILWSITHNDTVDWLTRTKPGLTPGTEAWRQAYTETFAAMKAAVMTSWRGW